MLEEFIFILLYCTGQTVVSYPKHLPQVIGEFQALATV